MSDQLEAILRQTPTSDRLRAAVWDLFYQSKSPDELHGALDGLVLPSETKARVLQLKIGDAGPSATSRFMSNAGELLNPIEAAKGVWNTLPIPERLGGSGLMAPVNTAMNVVAMHGEQARKAGQAFRQGRYSEGIGHSIATVTPVLGPIAAAAGEQIGEGDWAGGAGKATGLLFPVGATAAVRGAAKGMRAVPAAARERAATALEAGAADRVTDVMSPKVGPNKQRFGNQAENVAPQVARDMAENGAPWTREGLHAQVGERLAQAEQSLDAASDARLSARNFETKPLIDALLQKRRELTAEAVDATGVSYQQINVGGKPATTWVKDRGPLGQDVVPGPNAARVAVIDQAIAELRQLGPVVQYEPIRRIRQAYDQQAKPKYSPSMTADYMKAQGGASGAADVSGVLRENLAQWDPETAAANANYHVYRTANDVLEATREIERTRPRVGRAIMARLTGTIFGQEAAGTAGAIGGYVTAPFIESLLASGGTTRLKTANLMTKLAGAIRRGDVQSVDALATQLTRLRRGTSVQHTNEQATNPSGSRTDIAPATR